MNLWSIKSSVTRRLHEQNILFEFKPGMDRLPIEIDCFPFPAR